MESRNLHTVSKWERSLRSLALTCARIAKSGHSVTLLLVFFQQYQNIFLPRRRQSFISRAAFNE
jgi:hypothetical protein